ncbi:hypothetical protein CVT26_001528 [Gymnopilus dilepis]|uniref:Gfd2/YDR514C-like C-terminal domain-containing protein n=1 Tax=Gymnopilus dilepis TaxID=231916 RepID=A0A409VU16_9AGAR|nr:hypothetical protein CVT26_001528 [Gymnopilus dilepis]
MTDFTLVDPKGWEYDLHSVYSAYIGYFQMYNIPWSLSRWTRAFLYERSWGHLFETFEEFLAFSWPVITVTDARTGKAHIVTRLNSIGAFLKMIKTRFGETLPQAPNILQVTPFETASRHLRHVADYSSYKKLHSTLPAAVLSALKARVRAGDPKAIKEIWDKKDKTFLAIDFEWNERNERTVLEWGYAAVRCGHLEAYVYVVPALWSHLITLSSRLGHWPPVPDTNYRKGHYIVADYVDKVTNKHRPTYPWQFGESQVVPKSKLPQLIQAVISSLASPNSETSTNDLVLVAHNVQGDLARLEEMKIKLPPNMLIIDTMIFERSLYSKGLRGVMQDPNGDKPRAIGSSLSFEHLLYSLTLPLTPDSPSGSGGGSSPSHKRQSSASPQPPAVLPKFTLHNAGNDAFMCLFALQKLLEPKGTVMPSTTVNARKARAVSTPGKFNGMLPILPGVGAPVMPGVPFPPGMMPMMNFNVNGTVSPNMHFTTAGFAAVATPAPMTTMPMSASVSMPSLPRSSSAYDLADEFGQMQLDRGRKDSLGATLHHHHHLTAPGRSADRRSKSPLGLTPSNVNV